MELTIVFICGVLLCGGCQDQLLVAPGLLADYEQRMAQIDDPDKNRNQPGAQPPPRVGETQEPQRDFYEELQFQVPDLIPARNFVEEQLAEDLDDPTQEKYYEVALKYIETIERSRKIELSLEEVIRRTLGNSYAVRVASYNPAIRSAGVVEAEAIFDTVFFSSANFNERNIPTETTLVSSDSSTRSFTTGLTKLLPTGASLTTSWQVFRQERDLVFDTLNPQYTNQLSATLSQPLLRGFGLDFNRSQIEIAQNNRLISEHAFRRQVRDQLVAVERAYWQLVAARRNVVIAARLIAEFQIKYDDLYARRNFDASEVEITDAKSRLDSEIAEFLQVKTSVFDAEDNLKNLINDPELNLVDDLEIIPTEFPTAEKIVLDRMAALQTALDHRSELKEAKLAIDISKIAVGVAKNQALPRFDVTLTYSYDSLGKSQHDAFQNLSDLDFHTYVIGLEFEWPIGNRGRRAALKRARFEHAQSLAVLKQQIEQVILEVNLAVRDLYTNYEQISANLTSVLSQRDQVNAIVARAERRNPDQLNRELNARQALAATRQELLQSLLTYNFAIAELERAKGTLLEYNNVNVIDSSRQPAVSNRAE